MVKKEIIYREKKKKTEIATKYYFLQKVIKEQNKFRLWHFL